MTIRPVITDNGRKTPAAADRRQVPLRSTATLEALFRGRSSDEWRALYAGAYDWEPDAGREVVEE